MNDYEYEAYIEAVEELSQNVLFSLNTNFPVNVMHEQQLYGLLAEMNTLEVAKDSPSLRALTEYFLDNGDEKSWNLYNLLVGAPILV